MSPAGLVIERLRVTILAAPVAQEVRMSFGSLSERRTCLVEVDAGGLTGIGESWINYPSWAARERVATLCDGVAPLLVGREVSDPTEIQARLVDRLLPLGRQWGALGPIWQAISGVDIALWDLRGKLEGRSVAELCAADEPRSSVPAYASGVGPDTVAASCTEALDLETAAVKTKVGFGRSRDEATLTEARAVLGHDVRLLADANQAWDLAEARQMCRLLERFDIGWIEEPVAGNRLGDLERLAKDTKIPLATGENLYGADEMSGYIDSGAIGTVQPDLGKSGGVTVAAHVARHATDAGMDVAPHCYGSAVGIAASVQLGAAFPSVRCVELDVRANPLRTDLLVDPLRVQGGDLRVPPGPGLGIELDEETVRRYGVHTEERSNRDP